MESSLLREIAHSRVPPQNAQDVFRTPAMPGSKTVLKEQWGHIKKSQKEAPASRIFNYLSIKINSNSISQNEVRIHGFMLIKVNE